MSPSNRLLAGITIVSVCALGACSKEVQRAEVKPEKMTPTVTETERPGTEAPSDINPMTAKLRISDLKVGPRLGTDGAVAENVDEILPGEPVLASVAVGDVGAGSVVKAVWLDPNEGRIAQEVKPVNAGAAFLVFTAPDTASWKPGDYKVEIYLGDELASSESFDIVEKKPA